MKLRHHEMSQTVWGKGRFLTRKYVTRYHLVLAYKFNISNQGSPILQSRIKYVLTSIHGFHIFLTRRHQASQSIFVALLYNCITQSDRLACFKSNKDALRWTKSWDGWDGLHWMWSWCGVGLDGIGWIAWLYTWNPPLICPFSELFARNQRPKHVFPLVKGRDSACARRKIFSCICFLQQVMILLLCTSHTCQCTIFHQYLSKVWGLIEKKNRS